MKSDTFIAVFATISFCIFSAILFERYSNTGGAGLNKVESFITTNGGILTSVGTIALIASLAVWSTHLANRSAERREELANSSAERREHASHLVQSELKIGEFRQAWISEMRADLARFAQLIFNREGASSVEELHLLFVKVQMRLNLDEDLARELLSAMNKAYYASTKDDMEDANEKLIDFVEASTKYLKGEWSALKENIRKAQMLENGQ